MTREQYRNQKKKFFARLPNYEQYTGKERIIGLIQEAMLRYHPLRMTYHTYSSGRRLKRVIHPYRLEASEGSYYVFGYDRHTKEERLFKIDRIHDAELLANENFKIPGDLDFEKIRRASFSVFHGPVENVTVIFDRKTAPFMMEKKWHESQEHELLEGGRLKVSWRVSGTRDIKRFLMTFCEHVVVVEPKDLRDEIVRDAHRMISAYNGDGPSNNPASLEIIKPHIKHGEKLSVSENDERRRALMRR